MHPALIYFPDDRLSLPELCAARIDGHLVEVDAAFMPADTVEGASARASAVSPLVHEDTCAMGPTAAWIHGAGDAPPPLHHIQRSGARRLRMPPDNRRIFHDFAIREGSGMRIGPILVTDPVCTLVDLLRMSELHADYLPWASTTAEAFPELVPLARDEIMKRGRMPGKRDALAVLKEWELRTG